MMRFLFISLLLLFSLSSMSQQGKPTVETRVKLENERKELLADIAETQKELTAIRDDKNVSINQLQALQHQVADRHKLKENINEEVDDIGSSIAAYKSEINFLVQKIENYKLIYARSIRYSYESRGNLNMFAYLFCANDFNDAMRRMKYVKKLRDYRQQQVEKIKATEEELNKTLTTLKSERINREKLLILNNSQSKILLQETKEAEELVQKIKEKEKQLIAELDKKKKAEKKISNAINEIIISKMKTVEDSAAHNSNSKFVFNPLVPTKTPGIQPNLYMTPSDMASATNFEKSKGKLIYPISQGIISCHFGNYRVGNIEYYNNGIDIQTYTNGTVTAVFDGTVSSVVNMDGKLIVLIQHGNYFTVYNNLFNALVSPGDKVRKMQPIGIVANNEEGKPTLNFQIWRSAGSKMQTMQLNPEQWVGRAE